MDTHNQTVHQLRNKVSAAEWQARLDLAALYRLAHHFRLTDTIYTHISMRVPGSENFLINSFGLMYDEITASGLVRLDVHGNILEDPTGLGINYAGYIIHGAIHSARPDIMCVMHTHTRSGIAVSAQVHGLLPISQHASLLSGRVAHHKYEGVAFNKEEQARLVRDLGPHYAMILDNHGLLTAGRSAGQCFWLMLTLERACEAQIAALAGGTALHMITPEAEEASLNAVDTVDFVRDWAAMLRLVKRTAPDYAN